MNGDEKDEGNWVEYDFDAVEKARGKRLLDATETPRAKTLDELKAAVLSYLTFKYDGMAPAAVRMAEINRRFGVRAVQLGSCSRDLVRALHDEGKVGIAQVKESLVAWDKAEHDRRISLLTDPVHIMEFEERMKAAAFPPKPLTSTESSTRRSRRRSFWD